MISVIIPVYNVAPYLRECLDSVLAQTFTDWELLVVDDGSNDSTEDILKEYLERDDSLRIRYIKKEQNSGASDTRNVGVNAAQTEWIAFLDSDDLWAPDKLEKQLALMKEKDCGVVYSSYLTCDSNNQVKGLVNCKRMVTYRRMVCDNAIGFLTMMYDRSKTGDMLLPTIRKRQDWGFNIQLLEKGGVAYGLPEPLAIYKIRPSSVSRGKFSLVKYNLAIYRDVVGFSRVGSVLMFTFVFMPLYCGKKIWNFFSTLRFKPSEVNA